MAQATKKTTAPEKKAVATTPSKAARPEPEKLPVAAAGSESLPDFMKGDVGKGTEGISHEDFEVPRLKLIQGLSPELEEYNELRAGNFFHTATETIFDEAIRVVPVFLDRQYILWNPREVGGGILARTNDGVHWNPPNGKFNAKLDKKDGGQEVTWETARTVKQSGLADWGSMNPEDPKSPPAATLMYNFVLAFPDFPDLPPAVLTFQRSAIRFGRRFNTRLKTMRAPIYGMIFSLSSATAVNKVGNKFYVPNIAGGGYVKEKPQYELYKGLYESFAAAGLNIRDMENLQDDPTPDDGEGSGEAEGGEEDKPAY